MAKKQDAIVEVKKNLKSKKLIIGLDRTMKNIKLGNIKKVFLSSNCPESVKKEIKYYSKTEKFDIAELRQTNDEIGVIAKKNFLISVLSISK